MEELTVRIAVKLGSIAVHAEEYLSQDGRPEDVVAIHSLLQDPEIKKWLASMDDAALLPKKRNEP